MIFTHPDEAVRAYARGIDGSAALARSVVAHGREYARTCAAKGCRDRRERARVRARREGRQPPPPWIEVYSSELRAIVQRCSACHAPRPWVDAYILGGGGGGGRKGRPPGTMIRAGDLAPISRLVEAMREAPGVGEEAATLYVRHASSGHSLGMLAVEATRERLGRRSWDEEDVRRAVRRARAWFARELQRSGLLRRPAIRIRGGRRWGATECST